MAVEYIYRVELSSEGYALFNEGVTPSTHSRQLDAWKAFNQIALGKQYTNKAIKEATASFPWPDGEPFCLWVRWYRGTKDYQVCYYYNRDPLVLRSFNMKLREGQQ